MSLAVAAALYRNRLSNGLLNEQVFDPDFMEELNNFLRLSRGGFEEKVSSKVSCDSPGFGHEAVAHVDSSHRLEYNIVRQRGVGYVTIALKVCRKVQEIRLHYGSQRTATGAAEILPLIEEASAGVQHQQLCPKEVR